MYINQYSDAPKTSKPNIGIPLANNLTRLPNEIGSMDVCAGGRTLESNWAKGICSILSEESEGRDSSLDWTRAEQDELGKSD